MTSTTRGSGWLARVKEHSPIVAASRAEGEALFSMAPTVLRAVGGAGLFRFAAPRNGEPPAPELGEAIAVIEELAFADPSVAWAAVNSNSAVSLLTRMPQASVVDVLAPATTFVGVGLPPTGRADYENGRLRVSGRWPVVSGASVADWFVLHCIVHEGGQPRSTGALADARFIPVPKSAVTIEDTWRGVAAVKGSGSNAVAVEECFVSEERSVAMVGAAGSANTVDLLNAASPLGLHSLDLAAVAVGIGRASLRAACEQAAARISVVNQTGWADWPSVQSTIASIDAAVQTARDGLLALADRAQAELSTSGLTPTTQARIHAMADHTLRTMRHAVSDAFTAGSVDALRSGHPLEQCLRDIHAFSVQWERYRRLHYAAGRVLLGRTANDPMF